MNPPFEELKILWRPYDPARRPAEVRVQAQGEPEPAPRLPFSAIPYQIWGNQSTLNPVWLLQTIALELLFDGVPAGQLSAEFKKFHLWRNMAYTGGPISPTIRPPVTESGRRTIRTITPAPDGGIRLGTKQPH